MEAIKHIIRTPENHEVRIKIPDYVDVNETVEVVILLKSKSQHFDDKIKKLKSAMEDQNFLNDLDGIKKDLAGIDFKE